MIDTHAHLNYEEYVQNIESVLDEIKSNDVEKVVIPGVEPNSFNDILELCKKYKMLYMAVGVHPSEYKTYGDKTESQIYKLCKEEKVVAIGEIGLDYHYDSENKEEQQNIFRNQLEIAQAVNLPVIIHDRESHEDCFNILQDYKLKDVIFHCFSGNAAFAERCLERGYYIAVGGIVTFKNALDLKSSTKIVPLNRLLLETDSPYLAPVPYRGKMNTPAYLGYIAQEIANITGIDIEEIKSATTQNAKNIFGF